MGVPAIIEPVMQKTGMDCIVVCLAMLLEKPYIEVADAARAVDPHALDVGLTVSETRRVATKLGRRLVVRPEPDLDEDTGILFVKRKGQRTFHAVVLFNGSVYNPATGLLSTADAYLAIDHARIYKFLTL